MAYNSNVLPESGSETGSGSNNNLFQGPAEKTVSNDNYPDGFGVARAAALKETEAFPGSEASEWKKLKDREIGRFDELRAKAFGNPTINNAGIVLDSFGGAFGEGGSKPDIQGRANK
jgi:hypothetical protein